MKIWYWLLAILSILCIVFFTQVQWLKSQLEVRESAIENLVDETGVELIRQFRQAVAQVKSWKALINKLCKEWRGVLPVKDYNLYCG